MTKFQAKASVIIVVDNDFNFDDLFALDQILDRHVARLDYVLVANGVNDGTATVLMRRINEMPDTTVHFLPEQIEQDCARLIGMDNAVGDWILCLGDCSQPENMLTKLFAHEQETLDQINIRAPSSFPGRGIHYRILSNLYLRTYRVLTGLTVDRGECGTRFYSRAAAQYILHNRRGEMMLHCSNLGGFFPSLTLEDSAPRSRESQRTAWQGLARGWRILMRSTTFPLRFVTVAAVASCIINALYAITVVFIHFMKADVAAGWATLSLQSSLMFFVLSLLLALIGEYLIQIDRGVNHRLRYSITREIRSNRSRLEGARNVVSMIAHS